MPSAAQRELDRVGARGDADRLARAAERRELALERLDARAADEPAARRATVASASSSSSRSPACWRAQVEERDVHASAQYRSPCSR